MPRIYQKVTSATRTQSTIITQDYNMMDTAEDEAEGLDWAFGYGDNDPIDDVFHGFHMFEVKW
jgi:hypothetical protein